MTSLPTWRYEVRQVGRLGWLAPLVALGATLGGGGAAYLGDLSLHQCRQILLVGLEGILPLTVASVAVAVVARDPFREVQLAVPTWYRTTVLRRLTVVFGYACGVTALYTVGLALAGGGSGRRSGPRRWCGCRRWCG